MDEQPEELPLIVGHWDSFVIWCLERGLYRPRGKRQ
jgi:hypothetical protein